ncbi:MAG: hypothetical protein ACPGLY_23770 [Rubripirellula sp.]
MRIAVLLFSIMVVCFSGYCASECHAQNRYPSVSAIMEQHDVDQDGFLTAEEVVGSGYARQFPRWDHDQNGKVSPADVVRFRRRFGIAADGSMLGERETLVIPEINDLPRIDREHRPSQQAMRQSAYILRTTPHPVAGDQYVILTDHKGSEYLDAIQKLAKHRQGKVIQVDDLSELYSQPTAFDSVRDQLSDAKYVAIAMRKSSFRENTLLGMWELLSTIDDDAQLDVQPGLLLASDEKTFAGLIDRSISFQTLASDEVKPLAISQINRASETRSLQKAGVLRKVFQQFGMSTSIIAIYGEQAAAAPKLPGQQVWNLTNPGKQTFVKSFSPPVASTMADSKLWIMHGHGIPGMACSVDIDGLPEDIEGKIVLSGSCFSAVPWESDLPKLREAPGGYTVTQRDAFSIRAVDQGAVVAFGHQRLSSGFPHLYPVLEGWMEGKTVGQTYQELLNALIGFQQITAGEFVIGERQKANRNLPQNRLLYVVIGDPALQPFVAVEKRLD